MVASKAAYLLTLVNLGLTVQSAYLTLETNNDQAWTVVQGQYNTVLVQAGQRILDFDKKWNWNLFHEPETYYTFIFFNHDDP